MSNELSASPSEGTTRDVEHAGAQSRRADVPASSQGRPSGNWWYAFDRWLAVPDAQEEFVMA